MNEKLLFGREKMGLNQREFGKLFNREPETVSGWENNHDNIPLEVIIKYASHSNESLDYLFEITDKGLKYSKFELDIKEFGQKLKELREKNGKTQTELAKILNTNQSVVSRWENGKNLINISFFTGLINTFDYFSIDELFNRIKLENKK